MDSPTTREIARLLAFLDEPGAVAAILAHQASVPDHAAQIHDAYCLRTMKHGWTGKDKEQLWAWYESTSRWEGGYSFAGYLDYMVQELVALLTEHERNQMLGRGEIYPFPTRVLVRELNIDREIGNVARLTQTNPAWASGLNLTRGEIGYGIRLSCEFSSDDGERWMNTVSSYLVAVFPGLKQLFTAGLIEWLKGCVDPLIPRFMAMGLVFEALYRLTAHLKGYSVLQKSIRRADASLKFQYRMLDSRPLGICTEEVLESLIAHVPEPHRAEAKYVLGLAVKARNAIAHGAVTEFDQHTCLGMGHIIIKAVQTLVTAGQHHMVREVAYYRWLNEGNGKTGEIYGSHPSWCALSG